MVDKKRLGDPAHTLYLIDISSFIFRAFFAIRALSNRAGEPTNAVYGVATMLARLVEEAEPQHLAVVYDSKEPSFRKEIYPEYKANRSATPEDLIPQFARIEQLIQGFKMHSFYHSGMEADDLIATLAKRWCALSPKNRVVIVSSDKDLMQLVEDRVVEWDTMSGKVYHSAEVQEKLGVPPESVRDYLGLVGDSSDNIPGVPGVGPKTAQELLKQFGSIDAILQAAEKGEIPGKKGETLKSHAHSARLSAQLATLHDDLNVKVDLGDFDYRFQLTPACIQLLTDLDFHTLVKKWASQVTPHVTANVTLPVVEAPSAENRFRSICTEKDFQKLLEQMEQVKQFGFDLETTSLNPRQAELVGIAICPFVGEPEYGCYIPVGHRASLSAGEPHQLQLDPVLKRLKPFIEDPRYKKIGQNLKYDWSVLFEMGLKPSGIGADTMVAAYVIDPTGRHNLETLAAHYLSYPVQTYEEVCGKGKDQLCFDELSIEVATRYSAEDAWVAVKLWHELEAKLKAEGLMEIFTRVDLPLVEVLAKMERHGVCIDVPWLKKISHEFGVELKRIEERISAFTVGPVNLNSPKQLAQLLFEELKLPTQTKTKTGYSTDASVLEALAPLHEVPRLLLEYREISKLKGTYVDPLPELRDPKDGKIHASFHQTVTATGRLSSSDPNLQNIPIKSERGRKIRRAFIPSEGNLLISADYSQIELRILAHMSGDRELSRSFLADEDVHRRTASEIFGVPTDQVDDRSRGIAKAINFGLMYGKSAFALAQELGISRKEAGEIIAKYFEKYNGVKRYLDQSIQDAREKGYAMTLMGRKRFLPDLQSKNHAVRGSAERMAMNTPIQGTASDLMKLAMIELDQQLVKRGFKAKLTIQVHDEVVLDCPRSEVPEVKKLVCDIMENAMKLDVPLRVNAESGENWMEL
ncbi:DNA polymerase I [Bdellovibrionota bacterium FG-1]